MSYLSSLVVWMKRTWSWGVRCCWRKEGRCCWSEEKGRNERKREREESAWKWKQQGRVEESGGGGWDKEGECMRSERGERVGVCGLTVKAPALPRKQALWKLLKVSSDTVLVPCHRHQGTSGYTYNSIPQLKSLNHLFPALYLSIAFNCNNIRFHYQKLQWQWKYSITLPKP